MKTILITMEDDDYTVDFDGDEMTPEDLRDCLTTIATDLERFIHVEEVTLQ